MAIERNLTFQLGETWPLPFEFAADLTGAELDLDIALGDTLKLSLSDAMSPNPFALDSPAVTGVANVDASDQIALEPQTYNYEIRARMAGGDLVVGQFGRIVVGASLFAWPEQSTS